MHHCHCIDVTEADVRKIIQMLMGQKGRKPTPEEVEHERDEQFANGKSHCSTCLDYRIPPLIEEEWADFTADDALVAAE